MNRPIDKCISMVKIGRSGETFVLVFRLDVDIWDMAKAIVSWKARFDLTHAEGAMLHAQAIKNRDESIDLNRQFAQKMNGQQP